MNRQVTYSTRTSYCFGLLFATFGFARQEQCAQSQRCELRFPSANGPLWRLGSPQEVQAWGDDLHSLRQRPQWMTTWRLQDLHDALSSEEYVERCSFVLSWAQVSEKILEPSRARIVRWFLAQVNVSGTHAATDSLCEANKTQKPHRLTHKILLQSQVRRHGSWAGGLCAPRGLAKERMAIFRVKTCEDYWESNWVAVNFWIIHPTRSHKNGHFCCLALCGGHYSWVSIFCGVTLSKAARWFDPVTRRNVRAMRPCASNTPPEHRCQLFSEVSASLVANQTSLSTWKFVSHQQRTTQAEKLRRPA